MTPIVVRSKLYRDLHPGNSAGERPLRGWAAEAGVPLLDVPATVGAHMSSVRADPDGIHLRCEGHAAMGTAVADMLRGVLTAQPAPANVIETGGLHSALRN